MAFILRDVMVKSMQVSHILRYEVIWMNVRYAYFMFCDFVFTLNKIGILCLFKFVHKKSINHIQSSENRHVWTKNMML